MRIVRHIALGLLSYVCRSYLASKEVVGEATEHPTPNFGEQKKWSNKISRLV